MFLNIFLEKTKLPTDIILVILEYKYELEYKDYFDCIFKNNIITTKTNFNYVINSIEESYNLTQLLYYLQNYISNDNFITKYDFCFRIINCLGTNKLNCDFYKYTYNFSDILQLYHLAYFYYKVSRICFERSFGNNYKVYITIFDMDDLNHSKIKKSKFKKIKNFFKSFFSKL